MYFFYFFPIGLEIERRRPPVLTLLLMLFMTGIFVWTRYFPWAFSFHPARLVFFPGNQAPWTVVTAIFLHAGWFHFLGNLVYLWVFAPAFEDRLGRFRFLYYFLMLGAAGNVVHGLVAVSGVLGSSMMGVMGASGAVAGLLAFSLVRFSFARLALAYWVFTPLQGVNRTGRAFLPVPAAIFLWLLLQVVQGLVASESGSAVSYGAHLGGFSLGLFLALLLGYHRQGRAESRLVRGRRFLAGGEPYAAEGAFLEYLELEPGNLAGRLQLARARRMTGQTRRAREDYRLAFRQALGVGRVDKALSVFHEAQRGGDRLTLAPEDLAKAAFFLEKKLDFAGAVRAHLDLYLRFPADDRAPLALVRAIMLFRSKLKDQAQARGWLEVARRELPPGVWQDFLAREFRLGKKLRGEHPEDWPDCSPEPAT